MTDLVESIEIIQMDSVQEAFTKISKVAVSKNYFAIHHARYPVKLYSRKSGKFLCESGIAHQTADADFSGVDLFENAVAVVHQQSPVVSHVQGNSLARFWADNRDSLT